MSVAFDAGMRERLAALAEIYELPVPARYARFLEAGEFATCRRLHLEDGYLHGTFDLDFLDEALLDPERLGEYQGIEDLADGELDWRAAFPHLIPLSTLTDSWLDPETADESWLVKSFLVFDASDPRCPVAIWDYDGWKLYPLAESLDEFLRGIPSREPDLTFPPQYRIS